MDAIIEYLIVYRIFLGLVVLTLFAIIVIKKWWDEVKLFMKSVWYTVYKTRSLAKHTARDKSGWFHSERALCADFYSDINNIAAQPFMYDRAKSYLGKVQENGRQTLSIFMWLIIIGMVFIEALGFAYVFSGYTLPGASEKLQVQGAFGIAFLIAAVLVWLTHSAGSELHKRGLVNKARIWWNHDTNIERPSLMGLSNRISIENDHIDDGSPSYIQIIHRLDTNARVKPGFPIWTVVAFVAIVFVAGLATVVRYNSYLQEKNAEILLQESTGGTGFSLDKLMRGSGMPNVLVQPQKEAEQRGKEAQQESKDTASLTTYVFLALLFVLIQVMGIGIGFKTGFAGRESTICRRIIGPFHSRPEYEAWFERKRDAIARLAQKHLSNLQSRLSNNVNESGIDKGDREALLNAADRTFTEYYEHHNAEKEKQRVIAQAIEEKNELIRRNAMAAKQPVFQNVGSTTSSPVLIQTPRKESRDEMESRIRAELEAEASQRATEQTQETEAEMRERLRQEMRGHTSGVRESSS